MSQSSFIIVSILFAFVLYITAQGELPIYLQLLT